MTKYDIEALLKDLTKLSFIEAIEEMKDKEQEYKRSDFFKKHRIPLVELLRNYFEWDIAQRDLVGALEDKIRDMSMDLIVEKMQDLFVSIGENKDIMGWIEGMLENINLERVEELAEEMKNQVDELKK